MICYKIRSKSNPEMYLKGTPAYSSYDKTGRVFQKIGQLRAFLTAVINGHRENSISDWEIVELEMVIKEVKGVHEVIKADKLLKLLTK